MKIDPTILHKVIHKVAENHRNKSFDIYSSADIEQEVWIIALKKLPEFDISKCKYDDIEKSFEHWLNTVVSHRLTNLHRDKFITKKRNKNKEMVATISISSTNFDLDQLFEHNHNSIDFWDLVNKHFTEDDFDVLESILSNENINSYYKVKLKNKMKEIFKDFIDG